MSGSVYRDDKAPPPPPPPPPAPPLPPQRYGNRAASAIARFAQPFIYASRPPSPHGNAPLSHKALGSKSVARRSSSPASRTVAHKTGLPINAFDISPSRTHVVLAGREILKTVHVNDSSCVEDFNLRSSIIAYAATHDNSGGAISARHKDQLAATDVKWSHGKFDTTIATAAASGQIVIYDINRPGVELARLHEHSRQVHRIAFNPYQGALLLSGSQDATIRLWDLRALAREESAMACQSMHRYPGNNEGVRDLQWSPTEGVEFAAGTDNGVIQRWDLQKPNAPLLKVNAHEKTCYAIDWHPDGKHLASGGADKNVRVWDFSTADRRMKACWQLRAPKPVLNVCWRPASWKSEESSPGHWNCTQLATSYDHQDLRIHVWDLQRPSVPFREIDRYETSPSAMLWHSEDLLWSVGPEGIFTQSDINFASCRAKKQSTNTLTPAPDGSFAIFLERRSRRPFSEEPTDHHSTLGIERQSSSGDKLSSSYSATDGSLEEPSFLNSSIRARRRKAPSIRSSRSLAGTPPSIGSGGPVLRLDEAMRNAGPYRSAQVAAFGSIPGVFDSEAFDFLACHYWLTLRHNNGTDARVSESLPKACTHNANVAAQAGQYRLAQSWKILALALGKELEGRATRNLARRLMSPRAASASAKRDRLNLPSSNHVVLPSKANKSKFGVPSGPLKAPAQPPPEGGSNMATPLARPIPNASITMPMDSHRDDLDGRDRLELPGPVFGKRSPQKPSDTVSALSRLRSPSSPDEKPVDSDPSKGAATRSEVAGLDNIRPDPLHGGFRDIENQMSEKRTAMDNYRRMPRPLLRLEDSVQTISGNSLVPRFERHDSNESFQMFSASTDSSYRGRSEASSFASSQASGSSGPDPERWHPPLPSGYGQIPQRSTMSPSHERNGHSLQGSSVPLEDNLNRHPTTANIDKSAERPTLPTRVLHPEDTLTDIKRSQGNSAETIGNQEDRFIDSDFLPSADDPPLAHWAATSMLSPLINYHLNQLSDVQLPVHLIFLLGPYIKHDLPNTLITSVLLSYHSQLVSHQLYAQAAKLRHLSSDQYTEVAEHGTYGIDVGGAWCTSCNKSSKGGQMGFCSRCRGYWGDCPVCDGAGPALLLDGYHPSLATRSTEEHDRSSGSCWGWCQECGHGGHVACLRTWWDNVQDSEGACPTMGCMHDCVAGNRRAIFIKQKLDSKKTSAVKGDSWVVGESRAVGKAKDLISGGDRKENVILSDQRDTSSMKGKGGPLSMAAMGRAGSGGKKVRLLVPDGAPESDESRGGEVTSASAPS
ncbi:MAG: hypothetical protein Q9174_004707 [Haloplaca sp. 1 TL-2023]